ncbi:MAG: hypothetical protein ACKON7_08625 [Planctomycetaceae bacterium]
MEGSRRGIPAVLSERVLAAVDEAADGITRSELVRRFRTLKASQIDDILGAAVYLGRAVIEREPARDGRGDPLPGRPATRYRSRVQRSPP